MASASCSTSMPTRRKKTSLRSWPSPSAARRCSTSSPTRRTCRSKCGSSAVIPQGHSITQGPWRTPRAGATEVVVIGAGHAGLAMSRYLSLAGVDHIVLERGEVANSWRHERWDSLRLLTPNWQTRLPGMRYAGIYPDGFMTMHEVVGFIDSYARFISAPVRQFTT